MLTLDRSCCTHFIANLSLAAAWQGCSPHVPSLQLTHLLCQHAMAVAHLSSSCPLVCRGRLPVDLWHQHPWPIGAQRGRQICGGGWLQPTCSCLSPYPPPPPTLSRPPSAPQHTAPPGHLSHLQCHCPCNTTPAAPPPAPPPAKLLCWLHAAAGCRSLGDVFHLSANRLAPCARVASFGAEALYAHGDVSHCTLRHVSIHTVLHSLHAAAAAAVTAAAAALCRNQWR
jgi:hypothetical protein